MNGIYKTKYTTVQVETWDTISQGFYNTPYKVADLIAISPQLSDVLTFEDVVELYIPIIASESPDTLPPWKRGLA
jgi:hypothetical protein